MSFIANNTGGGANVATAGQGFMWGMFVNTPGALGATSATASGANSALANRVYLFQFVLDYTITIRSVTLDNQASNAITADVGIYDVNGNLLANTAGISLVGTGPLNGAIVQNSGAVTLNPGVYYFAQTQSTTAAGLTVIQMGARYLGAINTPATRQGRATNLASAGVLPATTGAIVADTFAYQQYAMFVS